MPKAKNGRSKYDWAALKKEFMESEYDMVLAFFREKLSLGKRKVLPGYIGDKTTGWSGEKKEMKARIAEAAIKKMEILETNQLREDLMKVRQILRERINKKKIRNLYELEVAWRILRTENGLPTQISENNNKNQHEHTFKQWARMALEQPEKIDEVQDEEV